MKNKEEVRQRMSKEIGTFENDMVRRISEACADIAQEYSDQQNKELRELINSNTEVVNKTWEGNYQVQEAEIQRLTAENKELMEKYKSVMALAQREQQQRIESDSEFFKAQEEIQRLTKEVERLNTCVKTYSDMSIRAQEQILEMEKQIGNWKVLSELNSKESIEKGLEIVRLTKELDEAQRMSKEERQLGLIGYQAKVIDEYYEEITRLRGLQAENNLLRGLLEIAAAFIDTKRPVELKKPIRKDQLIEAINIALNPKP